MRAKWFLAGVVCALAAASGGAFAATHVFGSSGTLTACAQKNDGQLRLVQDGEQCRESEQQVTWNVQGPPGPPGPPGQSSGGGSFANGAPCTYDGQTGVLVLHEQGGSTYATWCITPDEYEPDDTLAAARDVSGTIRLGLNATLGDAGDEDWYDLGTSVESFIYFSGVRDSGLKMDVYRDGDLVAQGLDPEQNFSTSVTGGSYTVRIYGASLVPYFLET